MKIEVEDRTKKTSTEKMFNIFVDLMEHSAYMRIQYGDTFDELVGAVMILQKSLIRMGEHTKQLTDDKIEELRNSAQEISDKEFEEMSKRGILDLAKQYKKKVTE